MRLKTVIRKKEIILCLIVTLLLLQSPLELLFSIFSYIDEIFALLGITAFFLHFLRREKLVLSRSDGVLLLLLSVFAASGLLGNLLWNDQNPVSVWVDLYTNLKFFLAVLSGIAIVRCCREEMGILLPWAQTAAVFIFFLLIFDLIFQCFPTQGIRYGIRCIQLFWRHPTYLAGSMVFLLSILTAFYQKRSILPIVMCLLVLFLTVRGKAMAGCAAYCLIFWVVLLRKKPLGLRHLLLIALIALAVAGEQFRYYYVELAGKSARSVLTQTALKIAEDYAPIGTGFATFGSSEAAKQYSQVYVQYGFRQIPELSGMGKNYLSDTFWPILLGQCGYLGTAAYVLSLLILFCRMKAVYALDRRAYAAGMFLWGYLLISSTSEPTFHNSIAIPLAMVLGYILTIPDAPKKEW